MARSFNGSSDVIQILTGIANPTNLTAACWVNPTALANAYGGAFWGQSSIAGNQSNFSIYVKSNGTLAMYYNNSVNFYDGTGSHTLSTATWYHLLFLGASGSNVVGYVNGISDGTGNGAFTDSGSGLVNMGRDGGTNRLAGSVADAALWSVALTSLEISALAAGVRPSAIRPKSLIAYWPLDGLRSPEPDLSGFAHNGIVTGAAKAFGPPTTLFTPRWPQFSETGPGPSMVFNQWFNIPATGSYTVTIGG